MTHIIYNIIIRIYGLMIQLSSLFNEKAKDWIKGRENLFPELKQKVNNLNPGKRIWFHCASLGEFEQARPLLERIKIKHPNTQIILSFFSPSGYNIRKNYSYADLVCYLPLDTPNNAIEFIKIIQPHSAIFIKYEFWYNYLIELNKKNIPVAFVSLIIRENHYLTKWYSTWFRRQLEKTNVFLTQDEDTKLLLESWNFKNVIKSGDTRFDRVSDQKKNISELPLIKNFKANRKLIVCGSTWQKDIEFIEQYLNNSKQDFSKWAWVIAPHNINANEIQDVTRRFDKFNCGLYSEGKTNNLNLLIIDNIGMLSSIYSYGEIAIIGGGFGSGIHNILEPAVFGLPTLFGPKYQKFKEALELIKLGGAITYSSHNEFSKAFDLLLDDSERQLKSTICSNYVSRNIGACEIALNSIIPKIS